jgi:putative Mg2+ transporter-C (MgtC) family protein
VAWHWNRLNACPPLSIPAPLPAILPFVPPPDGPPDHACSPSSTQLNGEGWLQAGELGLALVLSALIGLEREVRRKHAGLRTHTLVGVGAALFMLISKYGFTDVLQPRLVVLDPSRVAAQIVTGVGFLGAGLPLLAILATGIYSLVAVAFPVVTRRLPRSTTAISALRVRYSDGRGIRRNVLREATAGLRH